MNFYLLHKKHEINLCNKYKGLNKPVIQFDKMPLSLYTILKDIFEGNMQNEKISPNPLKKIAIRIKKTSPTQLIILSFLALILLGSLLLHLPQASANGVSIGYLDALFTSTSAICVTGLVTLNTAATWSLFGKIVILILIQIGGLGLVTFVLWFAVSIGKKVTIKDRLAIQASFNTAETTGTVRLIKTVLAVTLIVEGTGAILLFFFFLAKGFPFGTAVFYGIFHSVSAFCNAGFDILGDNSFINFRGNYYLNIVIMLLIFSGGLGFAVWRNLWLKAKAHFSKTAVSKVKLNLHTKLVLITTGFLLIFGTAIFLILEHDNPETLGNLSWHEKILASLFQSVTLRTAGFITIDQYSLTEASKLFSSMLALIGGSPGGTAGGMKTTTFAVIIAAGWSMLKGSNEIVVFHKTIPVNILKKAVAVITAMLMFAFTASMLLSATEFASGFTHSFSDIIYEVSSALGTVGITSGITSYLSSAGKLIVIFCMFVGRLGPISLVMIITSRLSRKNSIVRYPEDNVMVG